MLELAARKRIHEEEARKIEEEISRQTPSNYTKPARSDRIDREPTGPSSAKRHALFHYTSDEESPPAK